MRRQGIEQGQLFDGNKMVRVPQLQREVTHQAIDVLTNWLNALAKMIETEEIGDEQDKR
jgi:hypothetical protein